MFSRFKVSELLIILVVVVLIFVSEYFYVIQNDPMRAIFIGLWPPTILGLLIYFEMKRKK
jgi:lipopolysaccharide export LptBFGC system permease protein LptF